MQVNKKPQTMAVKKKGRDKSVPVRCRQCVYASQFIGNSCHCKALGRRVCACDRYGRICEHYERMPI